MIESLTLENFLSYREKTEFNFIATSEKPKAGYEHLSWYAESCKKKILKTIFLFGNNGSGKSNFLIALNTLRQLVLHRIVSKSSNDSVLPNCHFVLDKTSRQTPTVITVVFHVGNIRYRYSITWNEKIIYAESLEEQHGSRKNYFFVFKRTHDFEQNVVKVEFFDLLNSGDTQRIITENIIPCTSVLSLYDEKNIDSNELHDVHQYFASIRCVNQLNNALNDRYLNLCRMLTNRKDEDKLKSILLELLRDVGSSIRDYKVLTNRQKLPAAVIEFIHKQMSDEAYRENFPDDTQVQQILLLGHPTVDGEDLEWLPEGQESSGTINMIRLMIILYDAACNNYPVTIDECSMGIHQEVFNRILQFFLSISTKAQVFLATQALPILDMKGYRRDTARFFTKEHGVSHCESINLREFHANKNIYKNYVDGFYGGVPQWPDDEAWKSCLAIFRKSML